MKKLSILIICAFLALSFSACAQPALKTETAATSEPDDILQTPATDTAAPAVGQTSLWSIKLNGRDITDTELADNLQPIYMRVGCTPSDGYLFSSLIEYAGDPEGITQIKVVFDDKSFLSIGVEDALNDTTLLVTATDDEPLEKPLFGYNELIYMTPVAEIQFIS